MLARLALILTALSSSACSSSDADDAESTDASSDGSDADSTTAAGFDQDAVIARALAYATTMTRVNAEARPSQHGLADTVNVWVDDDSLAAYLALDPATPGAPAPWGPAALLVKEHLDGGGVVNGLTVMAQGDPSSTSGGWWWARLDADGTVHETGQVGFCISCHMPAEPVGWAFGVPLDNRQ